MMEQRQHKSIFDRALLRTRVRSANVKPVESLLGYLVGPFCAMLANGIFTTYLMRYFRDVLFAEELAAGSALKGTIESFLSAGRGARHPLHRRGRAGRVL